MTPEIKAKIAALRAEFYQSSLNPKGKDPVHVAALFAARVMGLYR